MTAVNPEAVGGVEWAPRPRFNPVRAAAVGGLSIAGFVLTDRISGSLRWRGRETIVDFVGHDGPAEEAWLALPGLGQQSSLEVSQRISEALDSPTAYVQLPHQKLSIESVGDTISGSLDQRCTKLLSVYGRSMGGIMMCDIAPYLSKEVRFKNILLDCSPSELDDVRRRSDARLVRLAAKSRYTGGVLSSMLVAAIRHHREHNSSIINNVTGRVSNVFQRIGPNGGSSASWAWQARVLNDAKHSKMSENLDGRLLPDTRIGYIMPENLLADDTVNVKRAVEGWEEVFSKPIDRIIIPGGSHAITEKTSTAYREAIGSWLGVTAIKTSPV